MDNTVVVTPESFAKSRGIAIRFEKEWTAASGFVSAAIRDEFLEFLLSKGYQVRNDMNRVIYRRNSLTVT